MTHKEFTSRVSKVTGKLFKFTEYGRIGAILKKYDHKLIEVALVKLEEHPTPHLIPEPLNFIQRIVSVESNKKETKDILEDLF